MSGDRIEDIHGPLAGGAVRRDWDRPGYDPADQAPSTLLREAIRHIEQFGIPDVQVHRLLSRVLQQLEPQPAPGQRQDGDDVPVTLPPGAVVEGYCIDPADGLRYPYGCASDRTFWIADQFGWAGWYARDARDKVLAHHRQATGGAKC